MNQIKTIFGFPHEIIIGFIVKAIGYCFTDKGASIALALSE
jgi:hypothetical protein